MYVRIAAKLANISLKESYFKVNFDFLLIKFLEKNVEVKINDWQRDIRESRE